MVDVSPENCTSYEEIRQALEDSLVVVVDVRNPDEVASSSKIQSKRWLNIPYKSGQLEAALKMPDTEFETEYKGKKPLNDGSDVVFNCGSGGRSSRAVALALGLGYVKARHYKGGLKQWKSDTAGDN